MDGWTIVNDRWHWADEHCEHTVSILLAVEYMTCDMEIVGVIYDVQHSRHCVGQQQSKLELPVSGLLSALRSDSSMSTIHATQ